MSERLDALTVRETNGQSYWTRIGVAFPNRSGPGFMVKLDAMPASNNEGQYVIHLREPRQDNGGGQRGGGQRTQGRSDFDDGGVPF